MDGAGSKNTVTVTLSDSGGASATATATATVEPDTTEPVISASSGTLVQNSDTYVLDLGNVTLGDTPELIALSLLNDSAGPTDLVSGQLALANTTDFFNSFNDISDLGAGDGSIAGYVGIRYQHSR